MNKYLEKLDPFFRVPVHVAATVTATAVHASVAVTATADVVGTAAGA